ncbi:MAG: hypothetical protein K6T63_13825 [Alicyclobacillus herbarius]|uniref:hypothetical protein n=1 Tax=Alicyclobacillus herbarius TaxID=122960 RepID=UPI0023540F65|nr:hypothetical protein [Alicyclobacillus herbarius]MCL6633697.1 hypothetical protein [Alicyclobacillus herbarius]
MSTVAAVPPLQGVNTAQSPPFTLPIRYMLLGVCGFLAFALDLAAQSLHLATAGPFAGGGPALTHLLTLASLLAFVMGAVYQLSTVAFLVPIRGERLARANFWLYTASIAVLIGSMAGHSQMGMLLGGAGALVALYVYGGIMLATLAGTKVRGVMQGFVLSAHAYLILAVTAAWLRIVAYTWTPLSPFGLKLLATHILLFVGGFFTFLIMGFSFKLLPMFTLAHGFPTWRQKWTLGLAHLAIWLLGAGIWSGRTVCLWLGAVAGLAAFVNHLLDVRGILKHRMRKRLEPPIQGVTAAGFAALLAIGLLLLQLAWRRGIPGWEGAASLYLLGWIALTIMGYAYKIIPFLIWTERYSARAARKKPTVGSAAAKPAAGQDPTAATGKSTSGGRLPASVPRKTPLIADLINLRLSRWVLAGAALGLVLVTAGLTVPFGASTVVGCLLLACAVLVFVYQMMRVIHPSQVVKELTGRD